MKRLLLIFFSWRLFLFVPVIVAPFILSYRSGFGYTHLIDYLRQPYPFPLYLPFVYSWANFDGVHYLNIAGSGYSNNMRFFPFYSLLIYFGKIIFNSHNAFDTGAFLSGFIISNGAFLIALIVFYRLLSLDYPQSICFRTVTYLFVFPSAFFLGSLYSESLFFLLAVSTLYLARKQRWLTASLVGALLTATRVVGVVILPVLVYEYLLQEQLTSKNWAKVIFSVKSVKMFAYFLLSLLGIGSYMLYNLYRWGNPFLFLTAQGEVANNRSVNTLIFPIQTIYRYFKILLYLPVSQYEWWVALLELATFIFTAVVLYLGWRQKIRLSYLIFVFGGFIIPSLTGTFTGLTRYIVVLFPIFIILAGIKNRLFNYVYIVLSLLLQMVLLMLFSRGYYVA